MTPSDDITLQANAILEVIGETPSEPIVKCTIPPLSLVQPSLRERKAPSSTRWPR
jgi:hypothetical protein